MSEYWAGSTVSEVPCCKCGGPATKTGVVPVLAPEWRQPAIFMLIGGSGGNKDKSPAYGRDRIGSHLGALDDSFYQRRLIEASRCAELGCAKRVVFRETFGRWLTDTTQVSATGYQTCPLALRTSWDDMLDDPQYDDWELIQYIRYGTGQYDTGARIRADSAVCNLITATCNTSGQIRASTCIDGLPEVVSETPDYAEVRYLEALIRAGKSGAKVYGEAWPEQQPGSSACFLWGRLPAMTLWANLKSNPPPATKANVPRGERIVIDAESTTAEQCAAFLRFCAYGHFTPMLYEATFPKIGKTVAELQKMAGRV